MDISVNVITLEGIFQPLADISTTDFVAAINNGLTTQLITTKTAARQMVKQESGVLLFFSGSDHANTSPGLGNVRVGFDAVESLRRQWAMELALHGIRTVTLLTGGIIDTFPDIPEMVGAKQIIDTSPLTRAEKRRCGQRCRVCRVGQGAQHHLDAVQHFFRRLLRLRAPLRRRPNHAKAGAHVLQRPLSRSDQHHYFNGKGSARTPSTRAASPSNSLPNLASSLVAR